jgi:hypothetical protein
MKLITIENNSEPKNIDSIKKINNIIKKTPIVIYFYMEGCPYCVTTTNEWNKIPNHINRNILDDKLLAVRINHILFNLLNNVGNQPKSFPTIRYVNNNSIIHYDKEGQERNASNLARWIEKHGKKRAVMNPIKTYQSGGVKWKIKTSRNYIRTRRFKKSSRKIKTSKNKIKNNSLYI